MAVDPCERLRLVSSAPEATEALGAWLGARVGPNTVLALSGDLGTGKTTFARGLGRGLGIEEGVASPSYTLMQAHEGGRLPLFHFDAWMEGREKALFLDGGDEWLQAGGVALIEWAGRVEDWLPSPRLALELAHLGPAERRIELARVGAGPGQGALQALLGELEGALGALDGLERISSATPEP